MQLCLIFVLSNSLKITVPIAKRSSRWVLFWKTGKNRPWRFPCAVWNWWIIKIKFGWLISSWKLIREWPRARLSTVKTSISLPSENRHQVIYGFLFFKNIVFPDCRDDYFEPVHLIYKNKYTGPRSECDWPECDWLKQTPL